jgi:hypothetical protein
MQTPGRNGSGHAAGKLHVELDDGTVIVGKKEFEHIPDDDRFKDEEEASTKD